MSVDKNIIKVYYIELLNAGDVFGKFLVENLVDAKLLQSDPGSTNNPHVYQVTGSIASDSTQESIILGTGVISKKHNIKAFKECHIVRGKYTLEKIKTSFPNFDTSKIILGDPGLTFSMFVDDLKVPKKYEFGILLHYIDNNKLREHFSDSCLSQVLIIDIATDNLRDLAEKMLSCENIITSSLHGIIFSHSLEIPVIWVRLNKTQLPVDDIKFYDYLSALNIEQNNYLCNTLISKLNYHNLKNLRKLSADKNILNVKKNEIINTLIKVFNNDGYTIKNKFRNRIN
ncbi:glycosyltransferase family protein [Cotonvirus japonicus]|uniref:Glycosyltransferase family protein n=1 Tax=Cotonvirus japonicus TaxID=2811091 RepID=A0ABM7NSQ2_9VIRU|nr:glycosyltransferase family protein [Cotonvirus japonicus]BCS83200.1 glycosyltransferase family protein [Cotonvirus japonicus]